MSILTSGNAFFLPARLEAKQRVFGGWWFSYKYVLEEKKTILQE
ncbi:MAG: hypothetical protein Q7K55_00660 [Candidatus Levybacteria bacterium]|nr:hypothetical protein [Candidatus Levybacteria bacterium]